MQVLHVVCTSSGSVKNYISLEKLHDSNINLHANKQIDMTQFHIGVNLDHTSIQITTLDYLGPCQTNMMNLFCANI